MEICLGCEKEFSEENMINTNDYVSNGCVSSIAGFYCKKCLGDKDICCYCGTPYESYEMSWIGNHEGVEEPYCKKCTREIGEYL